MKNIISKYFTINDTLFVLALIIALALAWNTVVAMQRNYHLEQRFKQLTTDVELQELENQNLKYNIAYLKSDDYLELAAREKFNKASPGETMVYLPGETNDSVIPTNTTNTGSYTPPSQPKGWKANLSSWWRFLRGQQNSIS